MATHAQQLTDRFTAEEDLDRYVIDFTEVEALAADFCTAARSHHHLPVRPAPRARHLPGYRAFQTWMAAEFCA